MPCTNVSPTNTLNFTDSGGTLRQVYEFIGPNGVGKGTIAMFFGGSGSPTPTGFLAKTKGFDETAPSLAMNADECTFLKEIRDQAWRVLMFKQSQIFRRNGTVTQELWLRDYVNWIVNTFPLSTRWLLAGHSAGAYIVGAHIQHLKEGISTKIPRNTIMSYPTAIGDSVQKTVFTSAHFNGRTTLFISGASGLDTIGYQPTKDLRVIACSGTSHHGWIALNTDHQIFVRINTNTGRRIVGDIINKWYTTTPETFDCLQNSEPCVFCN